MKKHILAWGLMAVMVLAVSWTGQERAWAAGDRVADATAFVRMLKDGQFAQAVSSFDDTMKQAMSAAQLQQTWELVGQKVGAFGGVGNSHLWKKDVYDIVQFPSKFGSTPLDIWVVYNQAGQISGLWFLQPTSGGPPASVSQALSAKSAEAQYKAPGYVRKERFDEYKVFVNEGAEWELPGTLTVPKGDGPFPAVVLVHGSGPNDRDETLGPNKPFKDIAWGLASKGIAVLRYDKRTKVHPDKVGKAIGTFTAREEVTDDAQAAVSLMRTYDRIDQGTVFVLGHSLGGMLVPRIGKADPKIAGLIVLAGPTRPLEDIMVEQITYVASVSGASVADQKKQIAEMKQEMAKVKALKPSSKSTALIVGGPPSYWLDLRGYRPAEVAKSLKQPMLILQGGRDYQVTEVDFTGWKDALSSRENVTFKLYPNLNHLFMDGVGKATPSEYGKPGSVFDAVIDHMASWIIKH